tara:strand:+ start:197 stop:631 length:435 start_codon:yes stop_codon:yes gene_type:complete
MSLLKKILILLFTIYILGCVEKTTYSGKIINENELFNLKISNKAELLKKLGQPSYIDNIQNKYFYFTEKNKNKNFYNKKIEYSYLFIFELDEKNNLIGSKSINLLDANVKKYIKSETKNDIVKRGLIEKIFGGVGPNNLPNTSQ